MSLKTIWKDYKVLIIMVPSLALVHWGWFHIKSSPLFQVKTESSKSQVLGPAFGSQESHETLQA
uniref:Uncharacterized protein n=1 Tax=Falco tinnunculus TaxID=100819 RepID=A0A8C4TPT1_FALTI